MRFFIFIFFILFFSLNSYSFEGIDIINQNYEIQNEEDYFPVSSEELSELEMKIFAKTFQNEKGINRLKRLEIEVMGLEQLGKIEDRFELLAKVSEYYKKNDTPKISNEYNYYDDSPNVKYYDSNDNLKNQPSKFQKFLDGIVDTFTYGTMTGYTTPMNYGSLGEISGYYPNTYYNPYRNKYNNFKPHNGFYKHPPPIHPPIKNNSPRFYNTPTMNNFHAGMGIKIID